LRFPDTVLGDDVPDGGLEEADGVTDGEVEGSGRLESPTGGEVGIVDREGVCGRFIGAVRTEVQVMFVCFWYGMFFHTLVTQS